jgi:hypothetical protein
MTGQISVDNRVRHGIIRLAEVANQCAHRREGDAEVESPDRDNCLQRLKRVPLRADHSTNTVFGLVCEKTVRENEGHQEAPSQGLLDIIDEPAHSGCGGGIAGFELEGEVVGSLHVPNFESRDFECVGVKELATAARGQNDLLRATLRKAQD